MRAGVRKTGKQSKGKGDKRQERERKWETATEKGIAWRLICIGTAARCHWWQNDKVKWRKPRVRDKQSQRKAERGRERRRGSCACHKQTNNENNTHTHIHNLWQKLPSCSCKWIKMKDMRHLLLISIMLHKYWCNKWGLLLLLLLQMPHTIKMPNFR